MITLLLCAFFLVVALGGQVGVAMLAASMAYMVVAVPADWNMIALKTVTGLDSFPLLAIPFFVLAGDLMDEAGVTRSLVNFSYALVGRLRGGLAHVLVVTEMILSGVSGSANADTAALAGVFVPAMDKAGYPRTFAAALSCCAGALGPMIPPSIMMVLIGSIANISVGRMFLGGALPGVIMGLFLMGYSYVLARRHGWGGVEERIGWHGFLLRLRAAAFPLTIPLIIIGGIVGGIVTPTEAGALAVVAVLAVGALSTRQLSFAKLVRAARSSVLVLGAIMFIVGVANVFAWILGSERMGELFAAMLVPFGSNPNVVLTLILLVLLVLGCVMDVMPLLIVLTPILVPIMTNLGFDPVHFGVVMTFALTMGLVTPPYGQSMFIAIAIAKITIGEFARAGWVMILLLIVVLFLISYIPWLVLVVPNLLMP